MNGLNELSIPTINGLKSLTLDELSANIVNSELSYFENIELSNIIVDESIILNEGNLFVSGENISSDELSRLNGIEYNIQDKFDDVDTSLNAIDIDINALQFKLTNVSYTNVGSNLTTISANTYINSLTCGNCTLSDIAINKGNITVLAGRTVNISAPSFGVTTLSGTVNISTNLTTPKITFPDSSVQNYAFTNAIKSTVSTLEIITQNQTSSFLQTNFTGNVKVNGIMELNYDAELLKIVGETHSYISMYPETFAGGRKAFIGFPEPDLPKLYMRNEYTDAEVFIDEYVNVNPGIKFPDGSIQTTSYVPSITLNQYSATTLEFLGQNINSAGTWYNFSNLWQPTGSYLAQGFYTINLMVTLGDINELQRISSSIQIIRSGSIVDESYQSGIYLQSSTTQREQYFYNLQFLYNCTHSTDEIHVNTDIHMKARSTSFCVARIQLLKQ